MLSKRATTSLFARRSPTRAKVSRIVNDPLARKIELAMAIAGLAKSVSRALRTARSARLPMRARMPRDTRAIAFALAGGLVATGIYAWLRQSRRRSHERSRWIP